MARQTGIIKLKGKIGDLSFYKSQGQHLAREKGGVDADRIKNDPAFARTRENGSEFGRAGKGGKLLRLALRSLILTTKDSKMSNRLTQSLMKAIKADTVNARGQRSLVDGDSTILKGFDFNARAKIGSSLFFGWNVSVDRALGEVDININDFIPDASVALPGGATHAKLVAGVAEIDFDLESFVNDQAKSPDIVLDSQNVAAQSLNLSITANTVQPIFVLFGIEYYQEVNGTMYSLKNGAYNALAMVEVDKV